MNGRPWRQAGRVAVFKVCGRLHTAKHSTIFILTLTQTGILKDHFTHVCIVRTRLIFMAFSPPPGIDDASAHQCHGDERAGDDEGDGPRLQLRACGGRDGGRDGGRGLEGHDDHGVRRRAGGTDAK